MNMIVCLALLALNAILGTQAIGQPTRNLVIFVGASNCGGYGTSPTPVSPDTGIAYSRYITGVKWARNNGGLISGNFPSGDWIGFQNSPAYGPEVGFMNNLQAADPTGLYAGISCSVGGSSIDEWLPARNKYWPVLVDMYTKAANRIQNAGEVLNVLVCCTMIGENGATSVYAYQHPTIPEFSDKMRIFISALRSITRPDLPIVEGRIGDFFLEVYTGDQRNAALYRRANQGLLNESPKALLSPPVDSDPLVVCVDTDGLPPRWEPNDIHFSSNGYAGMGERMYYAYTSLMGQ